MPYLERAMCGFCHEVAPVGQCPVCGHYNDVARVNCSCERCRPAPKRAPVTTPDDGFAL